MPPPTVKWGCSNTVKALDIGHSGSQEVEKGGPNHKKSVHTIKVYIYYLSDGGLVQR